MVSYYCLMYNCTGKILYIALLCPGQQSVLAHVSKLFLTAYSKKTCPLISPRPLADIFFKTRNIISLDSERSKSDDKKNAGDNFFRMFKWFDE